jgi:protein-S-isoprenylcysteine O-methyltransferase Ste14
VVAQTVLVVHVFWPRRRTRPPSAPARFAAGVAMGAGAVVATAGAGTLGADLTPLPLPPEGGRLRTGGPYAVVRHPVYAGVMLASVARGLLVGGGSRPAAAAALCALLSAKARWEERQMRARFPEYEEYARRTPRFVPLPGARRRISSRRA